MKIVQSQQFKNLLNKILDFIREDSPRAADEFGDTLYNELQKLDYMPYKFRQSFSYDNPQIRDFIFKGFVIPYLIDDKNNTIIILAIFKENIFRQ